MNHHLSAFVLAAPMAVVAPYTAAQSHPAQVQTQQSIDTVSKIARDSSLSEQQKIKQIENYANRCLDYKRISMLAVGVPQCEFTDKQKNEFISTFKEMIISMYSHSALVSAADVQMKLLPKMAANGDKFDVSSEIQAKGGTKYEVAYQFYQSGPAYKVYNIRLSSAGLVMIYRNQFAELIKQKDIDGTITTVKARGLKKQ